jgi:hypothetical protein
MYGPYFTAAQTSTWTLDMFSAFLFPNMRAKRPIRLIGKIKSLEVRKKNLDIKYCLQDKKSPFQQGRLSLFMSDFGWLGRSWESLGSSP